MAGKDDSAEAGSSIKFRVAVIADARSPRDHFHPFIESSVCPRAFVKFHPVRLAGSADDLGHAQFKVPTSCRRSLCANCPSQLGAKRIFELFPRCERKFEPLRNGMQILHANNASFVITSSGIVLW